MKRTARIVNDKSFKFDKEKYKDGVRELTTKEIKADLPTVILSIKESDVTASFIYKLFGEFEGKNIVNPYDMIYVPVGTYHNNKNVFLTTVGLYIFNVWFISEELFPVFGYVNTTIAKKLYTKMNKELSYALIEDRITTDQLKHFIEKTQHIMAFEVIMSPNMDEELMTVNKKINAKRDQLFKENKKALENGDVAVAEKLEKELLAYGEELLKDCPAMDTYKSGAGASMENFKSFFIDKGMNYNYATNKFTMVKSNYLDGISPEDYAITAASMTAPTYSRSKKTASGGYLSKLMTAGYQHLTLDPPGSDCGTDRFIKVNLTEGNVHDWMYSYIIEGNHLVELTSENKSKYIGKTVKMRFASMCESKTGFCNHCAGNLFYRIGVKNIGVAQSQVAERLKAAMLAQFHVSAVKVATMDINKAFNIK